MDFLIKNGYKLISIDNKSAILEKELRSGSSLKKGSIRVYLCVFPEVITEFTIL